MTTATASLMPPPGDVSVHLINMVLVSRWTSWFGGASSNYAGASNILNATAPNTSDVTSLINMTAGSSGSVIGDMMSMLSGMLLLIGAAILVYTYGTGGANATHTGTISCIRCGPPICLT